MAKMIIMKGLPACGKSTKAKELLEHGNTVRINKDLLRTMLHFDKFNHRNEGHTRDASRKLADWFLSQGVNVIIDDTNLNEGTVQSWKDLAKIHDAKIQYEDMTDVPIQVCLERDRVREKRVGDSVIHKMALQHLNFLKGERVVVCDLDGTLCDIGHRRHFVQSTPKDWKGFFDGLSKDKLRLDVVEKMADQSLNGAHLILVSARPETYRQQTEKWLKDNGFDGVYTTLIMRDAHDSRQDTVVKEEIFNRYLKELKIIKVFDDRPSVIRMWREKGLDVVDVGNGLEF
jgi:predicted kinase